MSTLVGYELHDSIATITMDDGRVNALSLQMLAEIDAALDRAAANRAVVVLSGRDGIFSAGFDLRALRGEARRRSRWCEPASSSPNVCSRSRRRS